MSARQLVNQKIGFKSIAVVVLALSAFGSAYAVDTTWNYGGLTNNTVYTECTSSACGATTLTGLSNAFSETSNASNYNNSSTSFSTASVYSWGSNGLGVVRLGSNPSGCSPSGSGVIEDPSCTGPHAVDNVYGTDAIVVGFGSQKVNLSSLTLGWNGTDHNVAPYTDSDLSVFAWVGAGNAPTTAVSPDGLPSTVGSVENGWKLIGNYADVGGNTNNAQSLSSTVYSSSWLISAYNTAYGSTNSNTRSGTSLNGFNDEFKLLALSGATCDQQLTGNSCGPGQVPEPSGLMLMGLALLGLATSRKWKARREQASMLVAA